MAMSDLFGEDYFMTYIGNLFRTAYRSGLAVKGFSAFSKDDRRFLGNWLIQNVNLVPQSCLNILVVCDDTNNPPDAWEKGEVRASLHMQVKGSHEVRIIELPERY